MTNPLALLTVTDDLHFFVLEKEPSGAYEDISGWADSGLTVRIVRGRKMRSWEGIFDEFAAALQFPWYFGENRDALAECVTDLGWLPRQSGYVIVVTEPGEVLADADADALTTMVTILNDAGAEWARPIDLGEWWDRPAVPFHVVLHSDTGEAADVTHRWKIAGAAIVPFPTERPQG
jgi:barstar (barnase inhibitor)